MLGLFDVAWTEQTILLPGNHDQLQYDLGRDLLQPLETAVTRSPMVLALRRPTLINGEMLFLPHIRGASKLQQILAQARQVGKQYSAGLFLLAITRTKM